MVAIIEGTKADKIINVLNKIPKKERDTVEEGTLDMDNSMHRIVHKCFTKATRVIDLFHVQKLAYDALQ